jgi:hypothetical protein
MFPLWVYVAVAVAIALAALALAQVVPGLGAVVVAVGSPLWVAFSVNRARSRRP